ncbi:MAG TPA: hypothetical protein VFU94_02535 [Conexibacter sp.]|nr:hypothetical protein [Conexibacter sp.]
MVDDLTALLDSRKWVKRRVDRVEFVDLSTVRRMIALTLDLQALGALWADRGPPAGGLRHLVPLGWFVPWANSGAALVDADERVIPYLTSEESDRRVERQVRRRLRRVGVHDAPLPALLAHRRDPGRPGDDCAWCRRAEDDDGPRELMADKWGCRAVLPLLEQLHAVADAKETEAVELARILLGWQTNFVLFARLDVSSVPADRVTLRLSFDEELTDWEPPWERRGRALGRAGRGLGWCAARECRRHVSRGGPFSAHLDALAPRWLRGWLARRRRLSLRRIGRRGLLGVAWHVAWHQASGLDVAQHHVDVVLPEELTVVRMRMMRMRSGKVHANVADQVGARATIVAPDIHEGADGGGDRADGLWAPALLSLTITQRSPAPWFGGAGIAALTGVALLVLARWRLRDAVENIDAGTATLLLAPTLVATVLSVRAASDIAEQLGVALRRLIAAVGILTALCAAALVAQPDAPGADLDALRWLWTGAGIALLLVAAALFAGGRRIRRLIAFGRRSSPRRVHDTRVGKVLNPDRYPRIPPPDRWLNVDEGDLIPWGWLEGHDWENATRADASFWDGRQRTPLVRWVRSIVHYVEPDDEGPATA